jgi:hypothetical protein
VRFYKRRHCCRYRLRHTALPPPGLSPHVRILADLQPSGTKRTSSTCSSLAFRRHVSRGLRKSSKRGQLQRDRPLKVGRPPLSQRNMAFLTPPTRVSNFFSRLSIAISTDVYRLRIWAYSLCASHVANLVQ